MASPTLTLLNHTEIDDADDNTGWNDTTTADADITVEGSASMSGILRADGESSYYDHGSAPVTAVGKTLRGWFNTVNVPYMQPESSSGYQVFMYDGSSTEYKVIFGSDTYFGGWFNYIWDCDDFTTLTLANVQRWGVYANHHTNAKNAINSWHDVIRYLDGYSMTGGTSGDKITLAEIATADRGTSPLYAYGVLVEVSSVFFCTGDVQFGTGATTMYAVMDGDVLVFKDENVAAGLYSLSGVGSGSDVVIQNSVILSAGTTDDTRYVFDWSDVDLASFSCTDNRLVRASTSTFQSGQTVTGNTFDDCGQITPDGADMTGGVVKNYEGTSDTSALVWDLNTDPDGLLDDMSFTKGTASTHAIEFGTNIPSEITLTGIDFSGYNASDDQTDSTLDFKDTSGTITVNLVGCSGNISETNSGCTVVWVIDPVQLSVTTRSLADNSLVDTRVLVETSDTSGPLPYEKTSSITRSASTATVTCTAHGVADGKKALIRGAGEPEYNGVQTITWISADSFSYTVSGTPDTPASDTRLLNGQDETSYDNSPTTEGAFVGGSGHSISDVLTLSNNATITVDNVSTGEVTEFTLDSGGSRSGITTSDTLTQSSSTGSGTGFTLSPDTDNLGISTSGVIIDADTTSGVATDTRSYSGDQPIKGTARKMTASPYYKAGAISGTIDSSNGLTLTVKLASDE